MTDATRGQTEPWPEHRTSRGGEWGAKIAKCHLEFVSYHRRKPRLFPKRGIGLRNHDDLHPRGREPLGGLRNRLPRASDGARRQSPRIAPGRFKSDETAKNKRIAVAPSGLEPEHPFGPRILNPLRLPIPPRGRETSGDPSGNRVAGLPTQASSGMASCRGASCRGAAPPKCVRAGIGST